MKPLPKRPHLGCDPMCDECMDSMDELREALRPVVAEAMKAFWDVIETRCPECSLVPLPLHQQMTPDIALEDALTWAFENLPIQSAEQRNVWAGKTAPELAAFSGRVLPFAPLKR